MKIFLYSSIDKMLSNKKYLEYGKNSLENSKKFLWNNTIEKYKDMFK